MSSVSLHKKKLFTVKILDVSWFVNLLSQDLYLKDSKVFYNSNIGAAVCFREGKYLGCG